MLVHKGGQINNVQLITVGGWGGGGGGGGGGGQGRCELRSEAFVKIKKKKILGGGGGRVGGSGWM